MPALRTFTFAAIALIGLSLPGPVTAQAVSSPLISTPQEIRQRLADEARPRRQVAFSPPDFAKFEGYYQLTPQSILTVERIGTSFLLLQSGQPQMQIYPEGPAEFFSKDVPAQVSFLSDAGGETFALVLHQNGFDRFVPRVDWDTGAQQVMAMRHHITGQVRTPGTAEALRRHLTSLASGQPDYDHLAPELAALVALDQPAIETVMKRLGTLKHVWFRFVNGAGAEVYRVNFEHDDLICTIMPLSPDGKITSQGCWYGPQWERSPLPRGGLQNCIGRSPPPPDSILCWQTSVIKSLL